jgi:predicted AlkP superfamily pyrophosphatase or phosphodiesterase
MVQLSRALEDTAMGFTPEVRRVVLLVIDGLRADAVETLDLFHVKRLAASGASTFAGQTVAPSVTAAAMTSLFTGVAPRVHGIANDRFRVPRSASMLQPIPRLLARSGLATSAHFGSIPRRFQWLVPALGKVAGVHDTRYGAESAGQILDGAERSIRQQRDGLIFLHWPDGDRVGHAHGWMSRAYADSARTMDDELGRLADWTARDPSTLLIVCADHGGGGERSTDHDSAHPLDTTIPIVLAGAAVTPSDLGADATLLDLPPTMLWALGVEIPPVYSGRPLREAFGREAVAA